MGTWTGLLVALLVSYTVGYNYPANEYEYSLRREELKEAELTYQGKENQLTTDERLVDHYLQHLKWEEFQRTRGRFLPSISLNETTMADIMQTDVYKRLLTIPKGGSMHSHENHEVSKRTLLEIVWNSTDFMYLWMTDPKTAKDPWKLKFGVNSPGDEWIKVKDSNYSKVDDVLPHQTLFGIMSDFARDNPTNTGQRWIEMDPLWGRASGLIDHEGVKREYLKAMLQKNLDEGVQYIETRKGLGRFKMYKVDPSVEENNGIVYVENDENVGELDITMAKEIVAEFIKQNPSFIGHKRISYSSRKVSVNQMQKDMDKMLELHRKFPDHLIGFDMVGEEDAGNSHIFFLENFMNTYDSATKKSKMQFYLHTAETNWPGDLITGVNNEDPVATLQNAYEAVLLGSKRVGHGLGYIKHPYLLKMITDHNVAVEICPISNQILGYTVDLRNHPGIHYIRRGIPVVLGADDPGTFGYDHFTIDWYAIFMAWGLDLWDMKQLSTNALMFSGMSETEKTDAMEKFNAAWVKFINNTKRDACNTTYDKEPSFGRILPREGLKAGGTKVHVFGRNFDKALSAPCESLTPSCKFGEKETAAVYLSNNHLVCEAPAQDADQMTVNVTVSIKGDGNWVDTLERFSYNQDSDVPIGKASTVHLSAVMVMASLLLLWGIHD